MRSLNNTLEESWTERTIRYNLEYFLARRVTFVGLEDFARKTRHNKKINFFESFVFESRFMQDIKTNTLIVITIIMITYRVCWSPGLRTGLTPSQRPTSPSSWLENLRYYLLLRSFQLLIYFLKAWLDIKFVFRKKIRNWPGVETMRYATLHIKHINLIYNRKKQF